MQEYYRSSSYLTFPKQPESDSDDTLSLENGVVPEICLDPPQPPNDSDSGVFEFAVLGISAARSRSEDSFPCRSESFTGKRIAASRSYNSGVRCGSSGARHKVVFGVAKAPAEMELGDMRKRQSRRSPAPMFPEAEERKGGPRWCGAHLAGALARASIGCMRLV